MSIKANSFFSSKFICEECGNEILLPRPTARRRKKNHLKHIYCIECKDTKAHVEQYDVLTYYEKLKDE